MSHRLELSRLAAPKQRRFGTDKEPDIHPALSGDEVYTPSPRRSEGWCGQLFARCSNRITSKTSILTLNEQRNLHTLLIDTIVSLLVQKIFSFQRLFSPASRTIRAITIFLQLFPSSCHSKYLCTRQHGWRITALVELRHQEVLESKRISE